MNVLFDLDGTLTNPREGIIACIRHGLSSVGEPCPADSVLERLIGPPLRDSFMTLLAGDSVSAELAVKAYRDRFATLGMFENVVYEGIPGALESLIAQGANLYVATSKPEVYAEQILTHFGLIDYFESVFGSELSGERSDKGDLINHVLETADLASTDTVMVGDRLHDVLGAHRNGVRSVGVLWGFGSREELVAAGAGRLCERPSDLAALLSGPR